MKWLKKLKWWHVGLGLVGTGLGGYGIYRAVKGGDEEPDPDVDGKIGGLKIMKSQPHKAVEAQAEEEAKKGEGIIASLLGFAEEAGAKLEGALSGAAGEASDELAHLSIRAIVAEYWRLVQEMDADFEKNKRSLGAKSDELIQKVKEAGGEISSKELEMLTIPDAVLDKWYHVWKAYAQEMTSSFLEWSAQTDKADDLYILDAAAELRAFIVESMIVAKGSTEPKFLLAALEELRDSEDQLSAQEDLLGDG